MSRQTREIVDDMAMASYQIGETVDGAVKAVAGVDEVVNHLTATVVELEAKLEVMRAYLEEQV